MNEDNSFFIALSQKTPVPLYDQIIIQIAERIKTGALRPGTMLPSIRTLAKDLRISVITVKRAYEDLEKNGFIVKQPGKGCYVSEGGRDAFKKAVVREISELFRSGIRAADKIALDRAEIQDLFINILKEENDE